ncbi:MAG: hypothetical protein BMS9Abin32_109 [Gammaproteobacteria bacterium]|nr:MAG: hypothetical protein BMS9Abin32_109 [Gammaproteobacteria bacterium]
MNVFDTLVLDTQGSELMVLQGAGTLLHDIRYIKTEVADFEAYKGCARLHELSAYLEAFGFAETSRERFATRSQGGSYYNVIYQQAD